MGFAFESDLETSRRVAAIAWTKSIGFFKATERNPRHLAVTQIDSGKVICKCPFNFNHIVFKKQQKRVVKLQKRYKTVKELFKGIIL